MSEAYPRALVFPGRGEAVRDVRVLVSSRDVEGIDFDERFAALGFAAQVAKVARLIETRGSSTTLLVGRSFGGWLLLHTLIGTETPYAGTVLLLAPVLGGGSVGRAGFIPPRTRKFWQWVENGHPMPASRIVLMSGSADTQMPIELARQLATHWSIESHELALGHGLQDWTSMESIERVHAALHQGV